MTARGLLLFLALAAIGAAPASRPAPPPRPLADPPANARLVLNEDWSSGKIDPQRWYLPRKKWGNGNNGVVPENVHLVRDLVGGKEQFVLRCEAHGDQYDGAVVGFGGKRDRVGGVIVSKDFFASGRFEVVMKISDEKPHEGGPADPAKPAGAIPAIWTYAYRYVKAPREDIDRFTKDVPLYNPLMKRYGTSVNEYWSELDFPELGKDGGFVWGLYNTFCQTREQSSHFAIASAADGHYHTFTTEWTTRLQPMDGVTDDQVVQAEGFWWVQDAAIPFARYSGNPLKKLGPNRYALYTGERALHWLDGKLVAINEEAVPGMAAQLTLGIWLPHWAGPARWKTAGVSFASIRVWQYDNEGDVRGILTGDLKDNFRPDGSPVK